MTLVSKIDHPDSDPEGYFKFYDYLINMHAEYLRNPLPAFKSTHARNQALAEFELTVMFINPYSGTKKPLKAALDILAEIAEHDPTKSDLWRGDTDVRLAKLNILAYQHPFFNEIPPELQDKVARILNEKFPSVLKNLSGQRSSNIDKLLDRMWNPEFHM